MQILDEEGIDAVTARALADRLGVRAPALYWHVGSKQEILDEMATEIHRRVARQIEQELDGDGWREGLGDLRPRTAQGVPQASRRRPHVQRCPV